MSNSFKTTIANTQSRFKASPSKAQTTFSSSSELLHGLCSQVRIREHTLSESVPVDLAYRICHPAN